MNHVRAGGAGALGHDPPAARPCRRSAPRGSALHLRQRSGDAGGLRASAAVAEDRTGLFRISASSCSASWPAACWVADPRRPSGRARADPAARPGAKPAATGRCPCARGRVLSGRCTTRTPSDSAALPAMPGCSGTVDGVLTAARAWLDGSVLPEPAGAAMVAGSFEAQAGQATRGLGWQRVHEGWSGGAGHGARHGPVTWIHRTGLNGSIPTGAIAWCLLTNRVHPSSHTETGGSWPCAARWARRVAAAV